MSQSQYFGSADLQNSTANQELVPIDIQYSSFSFMNDIQCHVSINNSDFIFIRANQGFDVSKENYHINSFIIEESNITFNWVGMLI